MLFRTIVTVGFLLVSVGVLLWAARIGTESFQGDLLLNFSTEIMGIVLTVSIVDYFFERRRMATRARQMAWNALHAVEHAVWVWQGGPRQMETEELLGLLSGVKDDDPIPEFTQNLLLSIGTRVKQAQKNDTKAVRSLPGLVDAFEHLSRMASIRDGLDVYEPKKVAEILSAGVSHLAVVLGLSDERIPGRLIRYRDPSKEGQEQRYFGVGGGDVAGGGSGRVGGGRRSTADI